MDEGQRARIQPGQVGLRDVTEPAQALDVGRESRLAEGRARRAGHQQPGTRVAGLDLLPGLQQQPQVLARLQRADEQHVSGGQAGRAGGPRLEAVMVHAPRHHRHRCLGPGEAPQHFLAHIFGRYHHLFHPPRQQGHEEAVPAGKSRGIPFGVLERAEVVQRPYLVPDRQRPGVGRGPQQLARAKPARQDKLLPGVTVRAARLAARTDYPQLRPHALENFLPVALYAGHLPGKETSVNRDAHHSTPACSLFLSASICPAHNPRVANHNSRGGASVQK